MPLFDRKCTACNQVTEHLEKSSDNSAKDCAVCGSKSTAQRMIAKTSFTLSGSGWYKDSYSKSK
jgi:putative FmdB family regulatory protein